MAQIAYSQSIPIKAAPGFQLERNAALALDRALARFGKRLILTGAWRSYQKQVSLFTQRYVRGNHAGRPGFTDDVRKWNGVEWTRRVGTAAAAVPGTSNHGSGRAIDVKTRRDPDDPPYSQAVIFASWNDADRLRFLEVAKDDGWADDEGRSVNELWHITYYPSRDKNKGANASTPSLEDIMATLDDDDLKNIANAVGDKMIALWNGISSRDTTYDRAASSAYYYATAKVLHMILGNAANAGDATGRQIRDFIRTIMTGQPVATNTYSDLMTLANTIDQLDGNTSTPADPVKFEFTGTATPTK